MTIVKIILVLVAIIPSIFFIILGFLSGFIVNNFKVGFKLFDVFVKWMDKK